MIQRHMIEQQLGRCVASFFPGATGVTGAAKLSGGASQETWSFDIVHAGGTIGAILRRAPPGYGASPGRAAGLDAEATLMQLAHDAGLPSPRVMHVLKPEDELGTGFIMQRIEGETIARKILRDEEYAKARPLLARQLGKVVAGIHGLPAAKLPKLREMTATKEIADLEREYRSFDWPRPVFELALRWLRERDPGPSKEVTLVHGDFRHGNLIIGADGVRAVLDWELAHFGDPMEDLGWICVNSWRFGEIDKPVGGFGSREDLFAGYEEGWPQGRSRSGDVLGSDGHAALGHHVLRHDAAVSSGAGSFDGARDDRTAFVGNRNRSVAAACPAREIEMQDEPTPTELLKAVADFLRNEITPAIKGHNAFKLRVGINALDLVTRQLTLADDGDAAEHARLKQLLGADGSLIELNRALSDKIAKGEVDLADAGAVRASVADHDGQARGRSAELWVVQAGVGG